jgi:hypothetical protein
LETNYHSENRDLHEKLAMPNNHDSITSEKFVSELQHEGSDIAAPQPEKYY